MVISEAMTVSSLVFNPLFSISEGLGQDEFVVQVKEEDLDFGKLFLGFVRAEVGFEYAEAGDGEILAAVWIEEGVAA